MLQFEQVKLLSDQVNEREIAIISRELAKILTDNLAGDVVEFGCYVGTTSVFLAKLLAKTDRQLWLYDSFQGLPEKSRQDVSPAGADFRAGELATTKKSLLKNFRSQDLPRPRVKKAWFADLESNNIPEEICFAFLDGDYYESVLGSLKLIWPRLALGATIIVDDYSNPALPGAARAVDTWLKFYPARLQVEQSLAIFHKR